MNLNVLYFYGAIFAESSRNTITMISSDVLSAQLIHMKSREPSFYIGINVYISRR